MVKWLKKEGIRYEPQGGVLAIPIGHLMRLVEELMHCEKDHG
jgi:hypothetical protein